METEPIVVTEKWLLGGYGREVNVAGATPGESVESFARRFRSYAVKMAAYRGIDFVETAQRVCDVLEPLPGETLPKWKRRAWREGWKAKAEADWCSAYEAIMTRFGFDDEVDWVPVFNFLDYPIVSGWPAPGSVVAASTTDEFGVWLGNDRVWGTLPRPAMVKLVGINGDLHLPMLGSRHFLRHAPAGTRMHRHGTIYTCQRPGVWNGEQLTVDDVNLFNIGHNTWITRIGDPT